MVYLIDLCCGVKYIYVKYNSVCTSMWQIHIIVGVECVWLIVKWMCDGCLFFSKVPAVCLFSGSATQVPGICSKRGWLLLLPLCLSSWTHPQFQWPQWPSNLWEVHQLGDWWWVSTCTPCLPPCMIMHLRHSCSHPHTLHTFTVLSHINNQKEKYELYNLAKDEETDYLMNYNLTTLPYKYYRYIQS